MAKIFVKPASEGLLIRFPENKKQVLSQNGEYVEDHREWQRKITFGDVVLATPPKDIETKKVNSKGKNLDEIQSEGDSK